MQPWWAEETWILMTGSVSVTWLMMFPAVSSLSLTFSCDGHHLYTANSEGTVIAWCRRDQQRLKLPMFYSFLSSYAAGWPRVTPPRYPHRTDAESDPVDPGRGGASMHNHHRSRPLKCHRNRRHLKILYHKEQGLVRQSERKPFPASFLLVCFDWFM